MKKLTFLLFILFTPGFCHGQDSSGGWESLFNGKDLQGWRELNGKHIWEAKDGMIVGTMVLGQPNGFLCTDREFQDFIFECEVSIDTLMNNSGIEFRNVATPDYQDKRNPFPEGRVHGYQAEIDPKPQKWSGSIYEEGGTRGWIYLTAEVNRDAQKEFRNNQWNKYRIEANGNSMRTWINGFPASNLVDNKFPKGFIGLQLHANQPNDPPGVYQVRFRNFRIKTTNLTFSPPDKITVINLIPNDLSEQEKSNGFSLLWDGKTTAGWKAVYSKKFPDEAWEIKDGELRTAPGQAKNAHIVTKKKYDAFELKFDFKITDGANSGIKFFVNDANENKRPATSSLEYQVVDDARIDASDVSRMLGSMADIKSSAKPRGVTKRTGEWNQGMIKVHPSRLVEYWLNGYKILECQLDSEEFRNLVAKSKYKDLAGFGTEKDGRILLENNGSQVCYRSIKIKEL